MFPFSRVLIADHDPSIDRELFSYAAGVLSRSPETAITLAARPQAAALRSFAQLVRPIFSRQGMSRVSCRYLPYPDWEEIHEAARYCAADLIIARPPGNLSTQRWAVSTHFLMDSPCPVWLAPSGSKPPRCIATSLGQNGTARQVLETASRIAAAVGARELLATHIFEGPVLDPGTETTERLTDARLLDLYCLAARVPMGDVACSLRVVESLNPQLAAMRLAEECGAGLLVAAATSTDFSLAGRLATLILPDENGWPTGLSRLMRQLLPLSEPTFS